MAPLSVYGFGETCGPWGGMYSDTLRVPYADGMLVPVPPGIAPETVASCGDNVTVGWCAVAPTVLREKDATVLVVGPSSARRVAPASLPRARDEIDDDLCQVLPFVFLEEVATADDGGMRLTLGAWNGVL